MRREVRAGLGRARQFGNFGALGAAWIFTEESWIKDHLAFLSFGKLRGSYGTTGSDQVGDYGYLTRWSSLGSIALRWCATLHPTQHADPNFHWPTNKKLARRIDLGFFKDRFHLSVDYYRDRSDDQLVQFPTPLLSGFSGVIANSPALVQNSGVEFYA